jgi:hypothetical protein
MRYFEKNAKKDKSLDDLIAGGIAGATAVYGTQPLEQIATRKIIEPMPKNPTAMRKFFHKWKGSGWRAAKGALAAGITFGTYGQIKKLMD